MLQYSKFVNTKACQKASPRKPVQFPTFSKSVKICKIPKNELPGTVAENGNGSSELKEKVLAPMPMHASVDLVEMQRLEELQIKNQDWLSFFLGTTPEEEPRHSECTALVPLSSSPASEYVPFFETMMAPPPATPASSPDPAPVMAQASELAQSPAPAVVPNGPACLDEIFREMILEDKVFKRPCD